MEPYWDLIEEIIRESDIVLEILDARFPELSRNNQAEEIIHRLKRPKIFVLNKADLVRRRDLEYAIAGLMKEGEVVYISNRQTRTIKTLLAKIKQMFAKYGKRPEFDSDPIIKRPFREAKGDIIVGVIGYPNVGKSSVINALSFKKKMLVSKKAGTTHGVHWIKASEQIKLIDTPGVIPLTYETESRLGLIAARNPEKIKDPEAVAGKIFDMFKGNKLKSFGDFYGIEINIEDNFNDVIDKLSKKMGHLKKGGVADEKRTSSVIIQDWQRGKLRL